MPSPRPAKAPGRIPAPAATHAVTQPVDAAEEAWLQGDFLRTRALLASALGGATKLPAALQQRSMARYAALAVDPFAVRVGLGTLVVYAAAWVWALQQR